jgi:hypothetical protein
LFAKQTFACALFYGQKATNSPRVENITTCDLYDTVKSAYLATRCWLSVDRGKVLATLQAIMSRGLGRIERAILALIEDKRARKNGYAAEALAVAAYQPGTKSKRPPTKAERVAVARAMRSLAHKYHDRIVLKGGDDRPLWLERR